jgi:hypothetical protein
MLPRRSELVQIPAGHPFLGRLSYLGFINPLLTTAYSHKHSPKKYTQHQHLAILLLRRRFKASFKTSYRHIIAYLAEMRQIQAILGLKALPHFTTLQKFMRRMDEAWLLNCFKFMQAITLSSTRRALRLTQAAGMKGLQIV